jgi:hypothetical protein
MAATMTPAKTAGVAATEAPFMTHAVAHVVVLAMLKSVVPIMSEIVVPVMSEIVVPTAAEKSELAIVPAIVGLFIDIAGTVGVARRVLLRARGERETDADQERDRPRHLLATIHRGLLGALLR